MIIPSQFKGKYIVLATGCWEWTAAKKTTGYGAVWYKNQVWPAHRALWEAQPGNAFPKEGKFDTCHACNNKLCVNPEHLYLGTRLQNMRQSVCEGRSGKKLFARDVILIRALLKSIRPGVSAYKTNKIIGDLFHVSYKTIEFIQKGITFEAFHD